MKLFIMTYAGGLQGESGISVFDNYKLDKACPKCGTMAQLDGNLFVKKASFKKLFLQTYDYDILIESALYNSLKLEGVKIGNLLPAIEKKSKQPTSYYHLTTIHYLPKMNSDSSGFELENQCVVCKRDGFFDALDTSKQDPVVPKVYKYNFKDIEELTKKTDIFYTWEHFGNSNTSPAPGDLKRLAKPRIIVKENLMVALKKIGVKSLNFEEVIIVG